MKIYGMMILVMFSATMTFASEETAYYYYQNEKVELSKRSDKYIVRLKERERDFVKILQSNGLAISENDIEKKYSHVFMISGEADDFLRDEEKIGAIPDIDIISPVYVSSSGKEFGVTDQLCVKFSDGISEGKKVASMIDMV